MERLTFVDEDGQILFGNLAGFPEDVGFTIRELAENEEWKALDDIAERLANCEQRLKHYEDLEEQGRLLKLPCTVGDTIYVIPSKTNYKLNVLNGHQENNRVYEQVVDRIEISATGYLLSTCGGMRSATEESYKTTWFLAKKEAEDALKVLRAAIKGRKIWH